MPKVKLFTFEERLEIERLHNLGLSGAKIADQIGRSKNGVNAEIKRCSPYTAKKAHKIADDIRLRRNEINKDLYKPEDHPMHRMKERLERLEMQVEILFDILKETK